MGCEKQYYPIKEVSEKTGVNAVTLRAWQRRYGLLNPWRTEKGHRMYCDEDIARIRHILYWLEKGVTIGKVRPLLDGAGTPDRESNIESQFKLIADTLLTLLSECNGTGLEKQLIQIMKEYPLDVFVRQVAEPVDTEIRRADNPLAHIQKSLWQSVMMERCIVLVSQGRKHSAKSCFLLSFDQPAGYRLWLEALVVAEQGYNVTILSALEGKLTALEVALEQQNVSKLVIFGEKRIAPANQAQLRNLITKVNCNYQLSGSISDIHPDLIPDKEPQETIYHGE